MAINLHKSLAANGRQLPFFCVLSTCLFFLTAECGLAIWGVLPIFSREDPYAGFMPHNPLFVERYSQNGPKHWATAENKKRYFNSQQFASSKSPRAFRIFCMGGSTTYGRPFDDRTSFCGWLRAFLQALYPSRIWEVINAGGISYASYRVVLLMEEIIRYDPDLFIVYSGHNEFLESITYSHVRKTPRWILDLDNLLNRTRVYSVLKRLIESVIHERFTLDGDVNSPASLPDEVDALLDHSIGPDAYHRDLRWRSNVLSYFRQNLQRMVEISEDADAKLIFAIPASNLKNNSPFKSESDASLTVQQTKNRSRYFSEAQTSVQDGLWFEAISNLRKAEAIDPVRADIQYHLGQIYFTVGDFKNAKQAFQRALDEDVCPLRALSSITAQINDVAAELDVPVVDFRGLLEKDSYQNYGHDILGEDYFYDHVHPQIAAHRKLAFSIIHRMHEMDIIGPIPSGAQGVYSGISESIMGTINYKVHGRAFKNLAKVFSWAGKSTDAARLARQALEILGPDAELYLILGLDAYSKRNWNLAISYYGRALDLEADFTKARNNLGIALSHVGRYEQAVLEFREIILRQPDHTNAHVNLANILTRLGHPNKALLHYRKALGMNPGDVALRKLVTSSQTPLHLKN